MNLYAAMARSPEANHVMMAIRKAETVVLHNANSRKDGFVQRLESPVWQSVAMVFLPAWKNATMATKKMGMAVPNNVSLKKPGYAM